MRPQLLIGLGLQSPTFPLWEMADITALVESCAAAPKRPTTYRKRGEAISN